MATSPIQEVFEEIIKDGFIEAFAENIVDIAGGSDDLGFWLSSLGTSYREVKGALGQLALGSAPNLKTKLSLVKARLSGDTDTVLEIRQQIQQDLQQQHEAEQKKLDEMTIMERLLKTGFFKGLLMIMPGLFFGSFDFFALMGLNKMIKSTIAIAPQAYGKYRSKQQTNRRNDIQSMFKDQQDILDNTLLSNLLQEQTKKPAEIDDETLNNLFRRLQDSQIKNPPGVDISILFNSDPRNPREELVKTFNEIQIVDWISELTKDYRFIIIKEELKAVRQNSRQLDFQYRVEELKSVIRKSLESYSSNLEYIDITGITLYDPNYILLNYKYKQIKLKQEFEEDVSYSATTRDILTDISKKYYKRGEALVAFMPDGTMLPLEEIHSDWLKRHGYNKDTFIFVAPQKYIGELAPLFDQTSETRLKFELDRFLSTITNALNGISFEEDVQLDDGTIITRKIEIRDNKVIIEENDGSQIIRISNQDEALSILFGMNKAFLKTTRDRIHQDKQVGIIEDSLFKIKSELCRKVFDTGEAIGDILQGIGYAVESYLKAVYRSQYDENPLYFTLLDLSATMRDSLYRAGLISSPTYEGLKELDLESRMLNNLVSIVSRHRTRAHTDVTTNLWVELYSELMTKYGDILMDKSLIDTFNFGFENLFSEIQAELIPSYAENTIRGEFIKEILNIFPDNMFISRGSLSEVLFKDKLYLNRKFLIEERINMAVDSVIYEKIEENILDLELDDFDFFTDILTKKELESIKIEILKKTNIFKKFYSGDRSSIKEEFTKKVFEVLFNNPSSPYKDIKVESAWPDWLLGPTGRGLELDGFIQELDFAFEMNGPYHNNPELIAKMFSISLTEAEKRVHTVQVKDQIKIDKCKDRGIELLILDYNMDYEKIVELCCKYYADLVNRKFPGEDVDWRDFHIDWKGILNDVKKLRMENLMRRFNVRQTLDEFEDL